MNRFILFSSFAGFALATLVPAQDRAPAPVIRASGQLTFVANRGQWDRAVAFGMQRGPATAWFHDRGFVLGLTKRQTLHDADMGLEGGVGVPPEGEVVGRATLRMSFVRAAAVAPIGEARLRGTISYLQGTDRREWVHHAPTFGSLRYAQLYPGVDAVFRSQGPWLAYDFHVAPGASAGAIELRCEGASALELRADGALCLRTPFGDVVHSAPRSFELAGDGSRVPVASRFVLRGADRYGFQVDRIDPSCALVIDPGIDWSTYLGGTGSEGLYASTPMVGQMVAVSGRMASPSLPAPWTNTTNAGGRDALVAVVDTAQSGAAAAVWSAVLGGSGDEIAFDVAYDDSNGLITIVGMTPSSNFPVTANAGQPTFGGQWDGFVVTFDPLGNVLYSSYLGTSGIDRLGAVQADGGRLTLAGYTDSSSFPMVGTPFQPMLGGRHDLVLVQYDPFRMPGQILASTYLGGPWREGFWNPSSGILNMDLVDLALSPSGEVTVVSRSMGPGFPTTPNACQTAFRGGSNADIVVARCDSALSSLLYGTYYGSSADDGAPALHVDPGGVVTLCGFSWASNFPVTAGAPSTVWRGRNDGVVVRLDPALPPPQQCVYSTYLSGSSNEAALGLQVEPSSGIATVTGFTSAGLVTPAPTAGAFQPALLPGANGFALRLEPRGNGLADVHYLSYVGGFTLLNGVAQLADGRVALSGYTDSATWPMQPTSPQPTFAGPSDGVIAVMDLLPNGITPIGTSSPACAPPSHMQVNSQPQPGNQTFDLLLEGAPANAPCLFALGVPFPAGLAIPQVPGPLVYVQPVLGSTFVRTDPRGFARFNLPIPATVTLPAGLAAQFGWVLPTPCGTAIAGASNALGF